MERRPDENSAYARWVAHIRTTSRSRVTLVPACDCVFVLTCPMSFFAGVYSPGDSSPRFSMADLDAAAALGSEFTISRFTDSRLVLLHGDLGVLPERGWRMTESGVGAVAGALFLTTLFLSGRDEEQPELAEAMAIAASGRIQNLRNANGTFALCCYDRRTKRLTLAADCIGARPLYYAVESQRVLFSTSLDVLVRMGASASCELAAYIEEEAMRYPLGSRTMCQGIHVLTASQALYASEHSLSAQDYFDWSSLAMADPVVDDLAAASRQAFREAVGCRAVAGKRQITLLSGGLDSRVLTAELLDLGYDVEAINLAPRGYQDEIYAARFAQAAKIPLKAIPWPADAVGITAGDGTSNMLASAVSHLSSSAVFTGDGGGETFGLLCMNGEAGEVLSAGNLKGAVQEYLKKYNVSRRLFKEDAYAVLKSIAHERMEAELERIGARLGEKAVHLFVILNDLRCHLHEYFNRIPRTKVELLLPFYDRRVITSVLRLPAPLRPYLKHRFYYRLIDLLPPLVRAVPWQAYPGAEPCPVPDPAPPPTQWTRNTHLGDRLVWECLRMALSPGLAPVLRRDMVLAAVVRHILGIGNSTYLFKTCVNIQARCGNGSKWVLREDEASPSTQRAVAATL